MRVCFYSDDFDLQRHLSFGLGKDVQLSQMTGQEFDPGFNPSNFDAIIIDLSSGASSLPGRIASTRNMINAHRSVIVMADRHLQFTAEELVRQGAYAYCYKPPSMQELTSLLHKVRQPQAVRRTPSALTRENPTPAPVVRTSCDGLIGSSPAMNHIYDSIQRVTNLSASVLLTGNSGTGKELVARAIHNLGVRSNQPFVAVSCSAIPETLIESELFGYEKGAFTGTVGQHQGYFEQAGEGTLFLDEVGDISLFTRLGGKRPIKLRARLIFATHRNLATMVAAGTFRQDLFYRINVVRINIPALQERSQDIPTIANHFLTRYSAYYNKQVEDFAPSAMELLQNYQWPGNVRELENVVQNATILADGSIITYNNILASINMQGNQEAPAPIPTKTFEQRVREFKFKLAMDALRENNGSKTQAARSLHVSRSYLHRLLCLGDPDQMETGSEI